jgi:hypothetical protein
MAYLREEKENIEVDYSIQEIWQVIPKAVASLDWIIQKRDEPKYHLEIKSKGGFLAYPTVLLVDLKAVDEKTTRMSVEAQTPVTTITSIVDIGRTKGRIEQLVTSIAKLMSNKPKAKQKIK